MSQTSLIFIVIRYLERTFNKKEIESSEYLELLIKLSEKCVKLYPCYLKKQLTKQPALTEKELYILRLIAEQHTNAEIAQITETSLDNAKQHCKRICAKLEVKTRHQAVQRAIELGILGELKRR